jgi:hypothetical protein
VILFYENILRTSVNQREEWRGETGIDNRKLIFGGGTLSPWSGK